MFFVGLIVALAAADLWFKNKIEKQNDSSFPRPLGRTKIMLYRNHNAGFPFGFLEKYGTLVRVVPLVITSALAGVLCYLIPKKGGSVQKLGLSLLIGGSVSNLYDRWVRRYVVDYFSIKIGWLKGVVLNFGDLFVFAGAIILLIRELLHGSDSGIS